MINQTLHKNAFDIAFSILVMESNFNKNKKHRGFWFGEILGTKR